MRRLAHLALVVTAAGSLLAGCSRPSDLPDGSVSRTKVDFQAPSAGGNPSAETLYVSNNGRGTLEAPAVSVSYQDGADWLTVTVTSSGEQYAIAVQPVTTGLAAGTYRATLALTWPSGSAEPTRVSVTLVVPARTTDPDPGFQTSIEAVAIEAPRGGGDPAPATFQVVNAGRGAIPVPSIDVAYAGTATGWLTTAVAAASSGYTVTAQARVAGIPSGVHHASLTLRAAGGVVAPRTLPVTLTVPPPEVFLSSREVAMRAPAGGLDVTASVTVANAGGGLLATPVATVTYDGGSAASWDGMLDVAVSGTPSRYQLTFTAHQVRSTPGSSKLPSGTHTATVQVSAPGAAVSDTVRVTLVVPAPVMQLSTSQVVFSEYASCPLVAGSTTVAVVNAGGGTLAPPEVSMPAGVESWLAASVAASGQDAYAVALRPVAFPSVQPGGTVETTVMMTDPTGVTSAVAVRVRFDALASDLIGASVTPSPLTIWAQVGMGDPAPRTLSLRTPAGCFSAPVVTVDAADSFDPASWVSVGAVASSPHGHDVSVLTSVAGLAAGDRRAATLHLGLPGKIWDVPVNLAAGTLAAAAGSPPRSGSQYVSGCAVTALADGRALTLAGGSGMGLFDPSTRTWISKGYFGGDRSGHGIVELEDGRILMCGGYDPITGSDKLVCQIGSLSSGSTSPSITFSDLGSLTTARSSVTLITLPRGRVLVVSGNTPTAEVIEVAAGRFTAMASASGTAAVKRPDGSILLSGGTGKSWLYSPEQDTWAPAGDPVIAHDRPTLMPLPDGRVMALGGSVNGVYGDASTQIWNPATRTWSRGPDAPHSYSGTSPITSLSSGRILAVAGNSLDVFDPVTGSWSVLGTWAADGKTGQVVRLASGMVVFFEVRVRNASTGRYDAVAESYTW